MSELSWAYPQCTYRLERQLMIRVAKQYKDKPGPLKFAHFFKNVITMDEVFKFLQKTKIATRNWLQNQDRTEDKGVDEGVEKGEE
jgi:hypothetical protein